MCTSQIGASDGVSSGAAQQDLVSYLMGVGTSGDSGFSGSDPTVGSTGGTLPPASGGGLIQDSGSGSSIIVGGGSGLLGGGSTDIVFH
jgi:hypothetical protein